MTEEQKIQFLLRAYKRGVPMLRAYRICSASRSGGDGLPRNTTPRKSGGRLSATAEIALSTFPTVLTLAFAVTKSTTPASCGTRSGKRRDGVSRGADSRQTVPPAFHKNARNPDATFATYV